MLYRRIEDTGEEIFQLVLPECFHKQALKSAHDDKGHIGRDKLVIVLRECVIWSGITKDVDVYLKSCDRCIKRKSSTM